MLVDNPMIHSPFEEPTYYWDYREGQPVLAAGRRPARALLRQVLVIPSLRTQTKQAGGGRGPVGP